VPTGDGPAWNWGRPAPAWNWAGAGWNGPAGAGSTRGDRRDGGGVIHGDDPGGFLITLFHPFGKGPDTGGDSYSLRAIRYRQKG